MLKTLGVAAAATAICAGGVSATAPAQPAPTTKPTSTVSAPVAPVSVSAHNNTVAISATNPVSDNNIAFQWDGGYSVTAGQPWGGVTTTDDNGIVIAADAGRSDSSGPAQWFNARTTMPIGDAVSSDSSPSELNFAFSGILTVNGNSYPVVFGQGHNAEGQNNWWFGGQGSGWTVYTVAPAALKTPDGLYAIESSDDDSVDSFEVEAVSEFS